MKKIKILIAMAAFLGLVAFRVFAVEKHVTSSQIRSQFIRLMEEHQKFIQASYSSAGSSQPQKMNAVYGNASNFEQNFFLNIGFLQDANIQNFLQNVEADITKNGHAGYTMMSYSSTTIIGGKGRSIQYTYQSHGKDITLIKQTNDNGKMLKSVYYYDINTQSLKADDFRENQIIHEKVYKI